MSKLKLEVTALFVLATFTLSHLSPPAALAHKGAMGIVKERMDKFEASEKATKRIKQALSKKRKKTFYTALPPPGNSCTAHARSTPAGGYYRQQVQDGDGSLPALSVHALSQIPR